jgi:hypothetical protein
MKYWLRTRWRVWLSLIFGGLMAIHPAAGEEPSRDLGPGWEPDFAALDETTLRAECERLDGSGSRVAAVAWAQLAARVPPSSQVLWRSARAHHRAGERLPLAARDERLRFYERALRAARRGRQLDPGCGECCLYEFAALGRIISIGGFASSATQLGEMASLVDVCTESPPTHADSARNQERANLWYGLAGYYRAVPDSRWLQLVTGARGDPRLALAYVERAVAAAPDRVDYQVELGASLLCLGEREGDTAARMRGAATLRAVATLSTHHGLDAIDRRHAETLLERPEHACGYSRDRWPYAPDAEHDWPGSNAVPLNASAAGAPR